MLIMLLNLMMLVWVMLLLSILMSLFDVFLIQLKVQGCCASGNALECLVVHTIAAPLFS